MTFDAVKKEMHDYIEHADKNKVMAIYGFINDIRSSIKAVYDETTLDLLEQTSDNMKSGKEKTLTLEETINNLRQYRSRNGL